MTVSTPTDLDLRKELRHYFGYGEFRGNQEAIIKNLLAGHDTFVIMPTGAGKSLCYQLPAIVTEGVAVVISPLIALMKNQVDQLNSFGINARFLNSTLSKSEINRVKREALDGSLKLLYVAPESLTKQDNISFLKEANLSFIAVDEAHCISEWGHDFRPEYRRIRSIIELFGDLPIIALTATATPKVQLDIQKNLRMDDATVFKSSFNRENLYYEVRPKKAAKKELIKFIKSNAGKSGIIYCLSRKKVEQIAEFLRVNDINALPYHAGLEPGVRMRNQDAFLNEEADVIVATIAFGMGIDKPDVRFVIHFDAPKSLEGYYQETGRAGRDGLEGKCVMFYSFKDILKLEKFNKDKTVTERDNARHLLEEIAAYAESSVCRRRQLLHYFGEHYDDEGCTDMCDNCKYPKEQWNAKEEVELVLRAIEQTDQKFDVHHISNILKGSQNQYVLSYKHNELDVYGKGSQKSVEEWTSLIRQVLLLEYLEKDIENYGVLKISDLGKAFLAKPVDVMMSKDLDFGSVSDDEDEDLNEHHDMRSYDKVLFESLKSLRKSVAQQKGLPPYVIFQDPSLQEMATTYPTTRDELVHIHGVGQGKAAKFGAPFLQHIKEYVEENDITTLADMHVKQQVNKSKEKIFIIQNIDKKIELEEIAESQGRSINDIIEEIEHICFSGTKLNLDYYIDTFLDEDRQDDIYDYFMNAETDDLDEAIEELGEDYTEEEIRLMRVKFLSEFAN